MIGFVAGSFRLKGYVLRSDWYLGGGLVGRAGLVEGATVGEFSVGVDSMWASMVVKLGEESGGGAVGGRETEWTWSGSSC